MVLQNIEKVVRKFFLKRKTWEDWTPEKKKQGFYQSANPAILRGYTVSPLSMEVSSKGDEILSGLVPKTIEKLELETLLDSLLPSREVFSAVDFYLALNDGLLMNKPDLSRFSFHKTLTADLGMVERRLVEYNLSLFTLHVLLESYILTALEKNGIIAKAARGDDGLYVYRRY